jgi:hypothetical protein
MAMARNRLKLLLGALMLIALVAAFVSAASAGANLLAYFRKGANPAAALNLVPNVPPDLHVRLTWRPDITDVGRTPSPIERSEIESAYLRAWLQLSLSQRRGEAYGLKTYFAGAALEAVRADILANSAAGLTIESVVTEHDLELRFLSIDGSIASIADHRAVSDFVVTTSDDSTVATGTERSAYDVIMRLEDGNWRVRHLVRREVEPLRPGPCKPPERADIVTRARRNLLLNGRPFRVRGVALVTGRGPDFWSSGEDRWANDLDATRRLNANAVRVLVPFDGFGGPAVGVGERAKLNAFLDLAHERGLKVIVSLFERYDDFDLLRWPRSDRHLQALLEPLCDHPAILAWDMSARPERALTSRARARGRRWLEHTLRLARLYDPHHLLTANTADLEVAAAIAPEVDIISLETLDEGGAELARRHARLRSALPDGAILFSGVGASTWDSLFFPGQPESDQASFHRELRRAVDDTDGAGYVVWSLYDSEQAPPPFDEGALSSARARRFGLYRADGSPKAAAVEYARDPGAPPADRPAFPSVPRFWGTALFGVAVLIPLWRRYAAGRRLA